MARLSILTLLGLCMAVAPAQAASMPSYWCGFTEPFISLFGSADTTVFQGVDEAERVAAPHFKALPGGGIVSGKLKNNDQFSIAISAGTGSDGMSDFSYPLTGVLGGAFKVTGGCVKLPTGTVLRKIVGVAKDDSLMLRQGPSTMFKVLQKIDQGYVWQKPLAAKNGWVRVVVVSWPKGEGGLIKTAEGWVNGKFLAKVLH